MTNSNSLEEPKNTSTVNRELVRDDLYEVCLIVAPVEMSKGKLACQTFQLAARWLRKPGVMDKLEVFTWLMQGTRTIVRQAKTPAIFQRVQDEVPGVLMRDEGFTEVAPKTATVYVCGPFLHKNRPDILNNKKVRLL